MIKHFAIILFVIISYSRIFSQDVIPYYSPKASVSQTIGFTEITINYCRPGVKERKVWGDLVPYDKVWRTGANEATTIKFSTDVFIQGNKVGSGKYSLFTIPSENEWTIILNKVANQWGAFLYNEKEDVLRFKIKPSKSEFNERLQFTIPVLTDSTCNVLLNWEFIEIPITIKIDYAQQVYNRIKEAISKADADDYQIYVVGARFAADHELFLDEALDWINKALSISKNFVCYMQKARILFTKADYVNALKEIEKCRDAGRNDSDYSSHITEIDFLQSKIEAAMKK